MARPLGRTRDTAIEIARANVEGHADRVAVLQAVERALLGDAVMRPAPRHRRDMVPGIRVEAERALRGAALWPVA
jgi:hypothetical protein